MAVIAHMATYPPRGETVITALESICPQVDEVRLVLNEYAALPGALRRFINVRCILPPQDMKDAGKFHPACAPDDFVFLCDDDILYPPDYVERMLRIYRRHAHLRPVLGVHGMLYPPDFSGDLSTRRVFYFIRALEEHRRVHQLGTGTVLCQGYQLPAFQDMMQAQRWVDLRFALHARARGYPLLCVRRRADWLRQLPVSESIFERFTGAWPEELVCRARMLAGSAKGDAIS